MVSGIEFQRPDLQILECVVHRSFEQFMVRSIYGLKIEKSVRSGIIAVFVAETITIEERYET
jgi:hypothetical protein